MTEYFANADGTYWGGYEGPNKASVVPFDAIPVPGPPPGPYYNWVDPDWVMDTAARDASHDGMATTMLGTPLNKTLRDVLLNIEARLVQAGVTADAASIPAAVRLPTIASAATKADYTTALKGLYTDYL